MFYLVCHCEHCNVTKNIKEDWMYCSGWNCDEFDNFDEAFEQFNRTIPFVSQVWEILDENYNSIIKKSAKKLTTPELCTRLTKKYAQQLLDEINNGKRYGGSLLIERLTNIINEKEV